MSEIMATGPEVVSPETLAFYRRAIDALLADEAPFMVGGSYALERYTGISRHSKDFDIFAREQDTPRILDVLEGIGCRPERTFPHWLAKAYQGEDWVDVIHGGGSGIAVVDEEWLEHSVEGVVLGAPVRLIPAEEMIWSKAFVMERERYDGADIAHIMLRQGARLDWRRLLRRFGEDWRLLMSYVVLFGYVYPSERDRIPLWVVDELCRRVHGEAAAPVPAGNVCRGPIISRLQYLHDIQEWGARDVRLDPRVNMTPQDIALWTEAALGEAQVKK